MTLTGQTGDAFVAVASDINALETAIGNLPSLTTQDKTSLVNALNELKAAVDAAASTGGATNLDQLTDVALNTPAIGHLLRHDGSQWVNVLGSTYFQAADSDLAAIAALTTTTYGRAFLTLATQADLMNLLSDASATVAGKVELATPAEAVAGTDSTRAVTAAGLQAGLDGLKTSILGAGVPAALDTLDELAAALNDDANFAATITTSLAGKQPLNANLTSLAALASGADEIAYATAANTWTTTPLTAFARSLLDDANVAAAQTTLQVYSTAQIGDPATDFVAIYNAARA